MRFAYGCLPSLMSLYFANCMVRREGLVPRCLVISVGGLRFQKKRYSTAGALPLLLRKFGPRFTGYLALAGLGAALPSLRRFRGGLMSFKRLAQEYDIPLITSDDFSGEATLAQLAPYELDLFVTAMCDQILREPLLARPRHGCVNLHASLLPEFRGVDSVFQAMLHDAPEIGSTLHRMSTRIDSGDIYGQAAFPRAADDTHLLIVARAAAVGARLLQRHVHALERGEVVTGVTIDPATAQHRYRSWPSRDELRAFRARGLRYWRRSDLSRILAFEDLAGEVAVRTLRAAA